MDTTRQLIRWGLPGWTAVLFFVIFICMIFALNGHVDQLSLNENAFLDHVRDILLPLAGAAIPGGFLIYQLYHWLYWHAPVPYEWRFLNKPWDRGKETLSNVLNCDWESRFGCTVIDTPEHPFSMKVLFIDGLKNPTIMKQYQQNWELTESIWYLAVAQGEFDATIRAQLLQRAHFLMDIYNSLGACQVALALAVVFTLVSIILAPVLGDGLFAKTNNSLINLAIYFVVIVPVALGIYFMLRQGRMDSYRTLLSLRRNIVSQVFLAEEKARKAAKANPPAFGDVLP